MRHSVRIRRLLLACIGMTAIVLVLVDAGKVIAQSPTVDWQKAAGSKMAFDVASVKKNKSAPDVFSTNVPLGSGDYFTPTGGLFSGTKPQTPQVVTAVGSYTATALSSGQWIIPAAPIPLQPRLRRPPVITSATTATGTVGTAFSYQITATNSPASYGATGLPAGLSVNTANGLISGTPTTAGTSTVTLSATNSGGTGTATLTLTINSAPSAITYVQGNSAVPQSPQATVSVTFSAAQTAGDLNVVVVGWNDSTATVTALTDTRGNTYKLAVGPTIQTGVASQSIYYASNIASAAAGANVVTVTFSSPAIYPDIRIVEYRGADPNNPVDVTAASSGNSASSSSGSATTTNATDLIFGANLVQTATTGPGAGFTTRLLTSPDGDIAEDQIVTAVGSYSATSPLTSSGQWIMQMVAFRTVGTAGPVSVTVTPATATVPTGYGTQVFQATVVNDSRVTFSVSGAGCSGNTCGTLSNVSALSATYTAPSSVPNPATVTLSATSVRDTTKTATATITVVQGVLTVAVSPKLSETTTSQTLQFTATVTNDPQNGGVTWSVDGVQGGNATTGTITASGLFTPGTQPGVHTVTGTSVSNSSVSTSVTTAVTDLAGVFTLKNDVARTGQNLKEYALSPTTVSASTFGLRFSCAVDGYVYAEPLYVANLSIGGGTHNVVFIATEHDSVYAFDADSSACTLYWQRTFLGAGVTAVPQTDYGTTDVVPEIGITSTPVIDPATSTLYVEAKTKETIGSGCSTGSPCYVHRLHALSLTTGAEKLNGPVVIAAPSLNFSSFQHLQRPALLLSNGTVYIGFGSHGDICPYQGWLFGYDATTLAQRFVVPVTQPGNTSGGSVPCNAGGIWLPGTGPSVDAAGNIYVSTGNGTFDVNTGGTNYGDAVVKVSTTGSVLDYFAPWDQPTLKQNDIDLGSGGVMILPDAVGSAAHPHLALATGKIGILYLLDQTNLGHFHSTSNSDVQEVTVSLNTTWLDGGIFSGPAYWNGNIYVGEVNNTLRQYTIANGSMSLSPVSTSANTFPLRGVNPAVSANGTSGGIVWVLDLSGWQNNQPAILDAYDALNLSNVLFSSPASGVGAAGAAVKFTVPMVANGKVYVGGQYQFSVFGFLGQ